MKNFKLLKSNWSKIVFVTLLVFFFGAPSVFSSYLSVEASRSNRDIQSFAVVTVQNAKKIGDIFFGRTIRVFDKIKNELFNIETPDKSEENPTSAIKQGINFFANIFNPKIVQLTTEIKETALPTTIPAVNTSTVVEQINQAGLVGSVGPKGDIGPMGQIGPRGLTGPQGPKGERGEKGESANVDISSFVTRTSFDNQIDRIFDAINDGDENNDNGGSSDHDDLTLGTTNGLSLSGQVLSLALASSSLNGAISSSDWNIFNNKQTALVSGTNIKTINGISILGGGDIEIVAGGSMVYPGAGISVSTGSAWGSSITNNSSNWNTAYGWGNHAGAGYLTGYTETDPGFTSWDRTAGISITKSQVSDFGTYSTDIHSNITALNSVSGVNTGDETISTIKTKLGITTLSGSNTGDQDLSGYSLASHNHTGIYAPILGGDDNYVTDAEKIIIGNTSGVNTGDETISTIKTKLGITTLSGSNTGDQNLSGYMLSTSFTDAAVTGKLLTGYVSGSGIISSSDTVLQAIQKLNGNLVSSGSGTVTSVSVVSANGISGSVANETTTPSITLTLGAISPSSAGIDNLSLDGNTFSSTSGGINITPLSGQKLIITGNTDITGDLIPTTNNVYNLGSATNYWHSMYVGPGSIYVDGQKVLQTDISDSVVVSADVNQNLILKTSGTGDIELNPSGTGFIQLKNNIIFSGGKTIETSDNSAIVFSDGISAPTITTAVLNGGISITPNGTGNAYVTTGKFGIGNTSPSQALDVTGNILASGTITGSNLSGTNTGDETISTIKTKLGITTLSGSNTGDQDLSGYSLTSHNHTGIYAPILGGDDNYVTDAEKIIIGNTSGVNTGDNAVNSLYSGLASSKQNTLTSGTNIKTVGGVSLLGSGDLGTIGDSYLATALTGKTYNGVSLSTSAGASSYLSGDGSYDPITSSQWTTSTNDIYYNTGRVFIGANSEAVSSSRLYLSGTTSANGLSSAIAGALGDYTFNPTEGGIQVGNRFVVNNSPTLVANTAVGEVIRIIDNTTLGNLVRGIDIMSNNGSNTAGINTGLRASGATFGIQGITNALAGGDSVPAALYGESTGTIQGDILRLYSKTMTSATSFATFYHDTSSFSGTGLLMDFATGGGTFSGNFVDFQKNNTPLFRVTNGGVVIMGLGSTAATSAICSSLANGTAPTADTAYEIRDCSNTPVADYAEMYPVEKESNYGDIMIVGDELVETYDVGEDGAIDWNKVKGNITKLVKSNKPYQRSVVGVISDNHGDFSSVGYNIKSEDNPKPIALNGRVPVKVSLSSESIKAGDYLTTSEEAGMATKALRSGFVIGKALEDWTKESGKETVMFFVEQGFYNSDLDGTLSLEKEMTIDGLTYINATKEFAESIRFNDIVEFILPPLFNSDTAGFAIIKEGSDRVEIIFDKPYIASPVVSITVSFDEGVVSEEQINQFFEEKIDYIVTNKTQNGFTIRINKEAVNDIHFSWTALSVKDPKIFESIIEGLNIEQDEVNSAEGNQVAGATGGTDGKNIIDNILGNNLIQNLLGGENNDEEEKEEGAPQEQEGEGTPQLEIINETEEKINTEEEKEILAEEEKVETGAQAEAEEKNIPEEQSAGESAQGTGSSSGPEEGASTGESAS